MVAPSPKARCLQIFSGFPFSPGGVESRLTGTSELQPSLSRDAFAIYVKRVMEPLVMLKMNAARLLRSAMNAHAKQRCREQI